MEINLTEQEKNIFSILLKTNELYQCDTIMRVAGGWVRDKLLNTYSDDIDIALDNISGKDFAMKVNEYLKSINCETHTIGVVKINPDQSKHLETARVKINDIWIDFVNLRTESYSDSRIPSISMGTPAEDAFRRDLTINAMFYNINENKIEDFTGMGMNDLKSGIIRTPIEAKTTFLDDPLRVLRAIRFANRLNFELNNDIIKAGSDEQVHNAIKMKLSKERIGIEINKIFSTDLLRIVESMETMNKMNLLDIIFSVPTNISIEDKHWYIQGVRNVRTFSKYVNSTSIIKSVDEFRWIFMAVFLLPLRNSYYMIKNKKISVIRDIIMDSLKWPSKDYEIIIHYCENFNQMLEYVRDKHFYSLVDTGLFIRKVGVRWMLLAYMTSVLENKNIPMKQSIMEFIGFVNAMGLNDVYNLNPIYDGNEIMKMTNKSPGPWLSEILNKQIGWQIENISRIREGNSDELKSELLQFILEWAK
jgi:tRNA nucleotidyltransferase (CCA-adding enzyme)